MEKYDEKDSYRRSGPVDRCRDRGFGGSRTPAMRAAPAITPTPWLRKDRYRGTDPDPYVRFELLREVDPANANG